MFVGVYIRYTIVLSDLRWIFEGSQTLSTYLHLLATFSGGWFFQPDRKRIFWCAFHNSIELRSNGIANFDSIVFRRQDKVRKEVEIQEQITNEKGFYLLMYLS